MAGQHLSDLPEDSRSLDVPEPAAARTPVPVPVRPEWAATGRKLGRYRLGPCLGRGGMGEVFEAWDSLLNRVVAVKTLHAPHPNAILRFMKEAQLQARVSHPNVCRIYDVDISDSVPFIAMQMVKGPSLFEAAPGLGREEAVEILATVAQAMHAAHRVNLIHRDIKPSNILLERSPGGGWFPFVADFGLAKDLEEEGMTLAHGVMGTPSFMAPEQKRGEAGRIGPPTDVYSLGATLCAVLRVDREEPSMKGVRPRPLWGKGGPSPMKALPRDLRIILQRCLEDLPEDRYPSAAALAEDLRRYLDGEPLLGRARSWARSARRFVRRFPVAAAALGVALLLGTGFGLWSARMALAARRRTALALRFAGDARDIERSIGVDRLHPPHDMRPLVDRLEANLALIQQDISLLGPEALGPGHLALGRACLALRYLEMAQEHLEKAWAVGHRTPDAAYALCKLHTEFYIRILGQEQMGDIPPSPDLEARHLEAARHYYTLAQGATWEPPEYCLARLLYFERRGAEALAVARQLFAAKQWFYEAKLEEAYAFEGMGYDHQRAGRLPEALACYRQCETAALIAQDIARSDGACYLASVDWRLRWLENPDLAPREALALAKEAERLVDTVLTIRAGNQRAFSLKVHLMLMEARLLKRLGRDPRRELDRAMAYALGAPLKPWFAWLKAAKIQQVEKTLEELGYRR